jgi:uncharacterized protein DUF559
MLRQDGLFTRRQALECGFTSYQIRRRVGAGLWRPVVGHVLAVGTTAMTPGLRDCAAALALPEAVLAGPSAARVLGIPAPTEGTYVWMSVARRRHPAGVRLLRGRLHRRDLWLRDGLWITEPGRTVFDCLRVLPDDEALRLLDRALQQRWTSLPELANHARWFTGSRGAPRIARLIGVDARGTRSAAERQAARILQQAGIRGWEPNIAIYDSRGLVGVGDLVFARHRLVIELDGWAYHSEPGQFQRHRERQNRLVADGWTVLRFTWRDLADRPDTVIATVKALLARIETST